MLLENIDTENATLNNMSFISRPSAAQLREIIN